MKRIIKSLLILIPLAILIHDAGSGRMSVFRDLYNVEHLNNDLWLALLAGDTASARRLLASGADINGRDKFGNTALHYLQPRWISEVREHEEVINISLLSSQGYLRVLSFLLDAGADTSIRDRAGLTPLHYAVTNWSREIAEILVAHGADVDVRDRAGRTPLHLAGSIAAVELLLANGANPNLVDRQGETPLHVAVIRWNLLPVARPDHPWAHPRVAALLIENGADPNIRDGLGRTPLDWVRKEQMCALLRKHGGKTGKELDASREGREKRADP